MHKKMRYELVWLEINGMNIMQGKEIINVE